MYNHVTLCGRLTRDLELRETANKIPYVRFTLAINNLFAPNVGSSTTFVDAIAYRNNAVNMSKFLKKGSLVLLEGKLQNAFNGQYDQLEVTTNYIYFLDPKKTTAEKATTPPATTVEIELPTENVDNDDISSEQNTTVNKENTTVPNNTEDQASVAPDGSSSAHTSDDLTETVVDTNSETSTTNTTDKEESEQEEGIDWDSL